MSFSILMSLIIIVAWAIPLSILGVIIYYREWKLLTYLVGVPLGLGAVGFTIASMIGRNIAGLFFWGDVILVYLLFPISLTILVPRFAWHLTKGFRLNQIEIYSVAGLLVLLVGLFTFGFLNQYHAVMAGELANRWPLRDEVFQQLPDNQQEQVINSVWWMLNLKPFGEYRCMTGNNEICRYAERLINNYYDAPQGARPYAFTNLLTMTIAFFNAGLFLFYSEEKEKKYQSPASVPMPSKYSAS